MLDSYTGFSARVPPPRLALPVKCSDDEYSYEYIQFAINRRVTDSPVLLLLLLCVVYSSKK